MTALTSLYPLHCFRVRRPSSTARLLKPAVAFGKVCNRSPRFLCKAVADNRKRTMAKRALITGITSQDGEPSEVRRVDRNLLLDFCFSQLMRDVPNIIRVNPTPETFAEYQQPSGVIPSLLSAETHVLD